MTQREHVEFIRKRAVDYIDAIRDTKNGDARNAIDRWGSIHLAMGAHTCLDLCDAWLEKNKRPEEAE